MDWRERRRKGGREKGNVNKIDGENKEMADGHERGMEGGRKGGQDERTFW